MARPTRTEQLLDNDLDICADAVVHLETVHQVRARLPTSELVGSMAGLFAALGDPSRLRIVAALAEHELCVCDLAAVVGLTESAVSHQLRLLRSLGLVRGRKEGRLVFYELDDSHVSSLYSQAREHAAHGTGSTR
jgi:ArsR family transcriptional regulator